MPHSLQLLSAQVLAALLVGCAGEPPTPARLSPPSPAGASAPYVVHAAELDDASGSRLVEALRGMEGVEGVELDLEAHQASVQLKPNRFLYEPQVQTAFSSANVELASFEPPSEALVSVYVVEAAGGG